MFFVSKIWEYNNRETILQTEVLRFLKNGLYVQICHNNNPFNDINRNTVFPMEHKKPNQLNKVINLNLISFFLIINLSLSNWIWRKTFPHTLFWYYVPFSYWKPKLQCICYKIWEILISVINLINKLPFLTCFRMK